MENSEECKTNLSTGNQNYVSCIKIHGLEILPPILSDEKRKCMQYYRDLAIQVEEKIKTRKCKRIHNDSTESENSATYNDSEVSSISESVVYSSDKSSNDELTFRSVMFAESCRSDVLHMLNDSQNKSSEMKNDKRAVEMPLLDKSAIKNVPLNSSIDVESDMKKCFESDPINKPIETLTVVTQESLITSDANNIDIDGQIPNSKTNISLAKKEFKTHVNLNGTEGCQQNNNNNYNSETSVDDSYENVNEDTTITDNESLEEKSPLIRRNSYIIENPSPFLLALINQNNPDSSLDKPSANSGHKRRRWNLEKAREKWSSIEQDLNHVVQNNSVKRNINFNSLPTSTVTSPETKMFDSTIDTLPNANISKTQLPEKESDIPTNDKPKHLKNSQQLRENLINGVDNKSETSNRFVKSYVTPLRKPNTQKRVESKYVSPVKSQSVEKTKKTYDAPVQSKKTDLGKNSLIKQRKLSFDELKRSNQSIKSNSVPYRNNQAVKSTEKSPRCLKNNSIKSSSVITKKINTSTNTPNVPEQQIREMINKISLEQSNQMAILLERQRSEQEQLMKLFAEQQALLLAKLRCTYQTLNPMETSMNQTESVIETTNTLEIVPAYNTAAIVDLNQSDNVLMECRKVLDFETSYAESSQNSQSSPEDSLQTKSPPLNQIERSFITSRQYSFHIDFSRNSKQSDLKIIDLELTGRNDSNQFLNETFCPASTSTCKYTCSTDSLEATIKPLEKKRSLNRLVSTCSRQLFPTEKQIWAATKLCAATRGFLIRRLIRTERVQNLVKTIRDSLLCAMELHHEKADNIQPADVELHRRLIQQVTAACFAFHDTFFDLSTSEQMSIIALDRERQKEKLLRPASAKSNSSLSLTTQKVLERKLKRRSSDSISGNQSRCSSSRSSYNVGDFRPRTKSLGMQNPLENDNTKKTSPPNDIIMHRTMSYSTNKKPWR